MGFPTLPCDEATWDRCKGVLVIDSSQQDKVLPAPEKYKSVQAGGENFAAW